MYKQFQNLAIECWQHAGARLGITDHALCLLAQPDAIQDLLVALDEIAVTGAPARRNLTLKPSNRKKQCKVIRLVLSFESDDLRQMSITRAGEIATLEFTAVGLQQFREAVVSWQKGFEDFSIHPDVARTKDRKPATKDLQSAEVWFWMRMEP